MERNELNIISKIAEGGQKIVYFAESKTDPSIKVVVKDAKINSMASLQRITREVNFLSGLDSHYFPKNYGSTFDMTTMTMTVIEEHVEGKTLRDVMTNYQSWDEIRNLLNELINAMEFVWENNVVHRDLKPENIIIRTDGKPCIIDFGIARFLDMESITNTLQQMGPCTPLYASPEQLRNDKTSIDIRTDFYAIGIIALELYLQHHPFDPNIVGGGLLYDNLIQGKYALPNNGNPEDSSVTSVVERLLQVQPYMRPRTISQFRKLINTI